jgi:hypothetical protein
MNAKSVTALNAALITLATVTSAHASGAATNKVFISGPLILIFLGFCALVVVVQLIPAITALYGMLKGAKDSKVEARAEAKSR